jgi:hypothetical protein
LKKNNDEIISMNKTGAMEENYSMSEMDRLKEENKRLKRTLLERFDETFM